MDSLPYVASNFGCGDDCWPHNWLVPSADINSGNDPDFRAKTWRDRFGFLGKHGVHDRDPREFLSSDPHAYRDRRIRIG